jgi:uncharacterized protein YidB (DUF937 family)
MGFFDQIRAVIGSQVEQEAHVMFNQALSGTSVGGLGGLLTQLEQGGLGTAVQAWSQGNAHPAVGVDQLRNALGDSHLQNIAGQLGLPVEGMLAHLVEQLPALAQAHAATQ